MKWQFPTLQAVAASALVVLTGCAGEVTEQAAAPAAEAEIILRERSFIPDPGVETELSLAMESGTEPLVRGIIQFGAPLTPEGHRELDESGIVLYEYLGGNSYLAGFPAEAPLGAFAAFRWAGELRSADKLRPELAELDLQDWALDSVTGRVQLLVRFYPDVAAEQVSLELESVGVVGEPYGSANTWAVVADPELIGELAGLNGVISIEEGPLPFLPLGPNEGGRRVANTDAAQQSTFATLQPGYRNVSGLGIQIGICDSGVDQGHDDFDAITAAGNAGASRVYNQRVGSDDHGTHVASIAAGSGLNSANNGLPAFSLRGHAPRAGVGDYPQFGGNAQAFHDAIVNDGTDVTNHSYVQSMSVYNTRAIDLDLLVRGDGTDNNGNAIPAQPQVWAVGNNGTWAQYGDEEGYYAVFTSAKNTISVGSVDTRNGRLSDFSSRGPTFDGRIKPDVVAPGCLNSIANQDIIAADGGTQGYRGMCGTSMAAPVVSGIIALMMEEFTGGGGQLANVFPSTYKAILVQTARDMEKTAPYATEEFEDPDTQDTLLYHAGPDFSTGFGLVDADAARATIGDTHRWRQSSLGATGTTHRYCITVPTGSEELKVAIAWDDEPGSDQTAETAAKLVNDLDLELHSPTGATVLPWTLDPLPLTANPGDGAQDPITPADVVPARRDVDRRNNVEMANAFLPGAGTWRAEVSAFALPTGNTQPYSLASSHPIRPFCPIGPGDICVRYPWLCFDIVPNVCDRWPQVCEPIELPDRPPVGGPWIIDPRVPTPIDEICKYVLDCPGCEGRGWALCPGWEIAIDNLPPDAVVTIFTREGTIVAADTIRATSRVLRVDRGRAGEQYLIAFANRDGNPYPSMLKLRLDIRKR